MNTVVNTYTTAGLIATTPRHLVTVDGLPITSFRLAATSNDKETNWFTVMVFNQLAVNAAISFSKGDRIVLTGALRVRDWDNGTNTGTAVEIEASSLGHDLNYGSSTFTRTVKVSEVDA